jgi:3-oxoacyl-[acyl-carrier protein] reductase
MGLAESGLASINFRGLAAAMNPLPASPRVVLITGAAGGLGRALVSAFAVDGCQVIATWHREPFTEPDCGQECPRSREGGLSSPPNILPVCPLQLDVTRREEVTAVFDEVLTKHGRLDVLINNAGVAVDSLVAQMTGDTWQRVLDVNLKGAFLCSQAAIRPMLKQRDGHILNISSFGGRVGRAGQANYAASKAALIGLTQSLAKEVGSRNVRVNAVLPGFLRTKLVGTLTEEQLAARAASNTLGRLNDLDEVARFIVFLAGMRNVSGQVFQLDSRIAAWT